MFVTLLLISVSTDYTRRYIPSHTYHGQKCAPDQGMARTGLVRGIVISIIQTSREGSEKLIRRRNVLRISRCTKRANLVLKRNNYLTLHCLYCGTRLILYVGVPFQYRQIGNNLYRFSDSTRDFSRHGANTTPLCTAFQTGTLFSVCRVTAEYATDHFVYSLCVVSQSVHPDASRSLK